MKRRIALSAVRARVPAGLRLPRGFDAFVEAAAATDPATTAWFEIAWTDPRRFELTPEAAGGLLPFLRLGDGGVVAFWIAAPRGLPLVHLDSEGGRRLVAASLDDLLGRLARRRSGVPDLDEGDDVSGLVGGAGKGKPAALAGLSKAFARWVRQGSALQPPAAAPDGERLRRRLVALAGTMVRDGLQAYETARSWWSVELRVEWKGGAPRAAYLDQGDWRPLPARYAAAPLLSELRAMARHPTLRRCQVSILRDGLVSVDRDRELVLQPPGV